MRGQELDRRSIAPGLLLAALLSWVPLVSIIASPLTWGDKPARAPIHWSLNGVPDGWDSPTAGLWFCIMFGTILGIASTLIVILNRDDLPRAKGAAGLGAVAWFLGALTWLWFVMVSTARGHNAGTVILPGLVYGLVMAGLVALPRFVTPERPPGSSATDLDDQP